MYFLYYNPVSVYLWFFYFIVITFYRVLEKPWRRRGAGYDSSRGLIIAGGTAGVRTALPGATEQPNS